MSQQYRLARGGKARMQQRTPIDENKHKFNNLRRNHQLRSLNLKIIGNQNRPVQILTARKAKQDGLTGRAAKIQANLQHMQQAARKKKDAQEHYYGQGKSPLHKQNFKQQINPQQQHKINNTRNISSVQQRLGANNAQSFNNTANRKQFVPQAKQEKINRIQNYNLKKVQNKSPNNQQKFRQNNQHNQQKFNHNNQKFNQKQNKSSSVRTVNPRTGEVKFLRPIRRKNINVKQQPRNLTVSVHNQKNNQGTHIPKHHVVTELNPQIQEEIRLIQNESSKMISHFPSIIPETNVPIMTTKTTLHERFSRI